jgi:hypothetical protein
LIDTLDLDKLDKGGYSGTAQDLFDTRNMGDASENATVNTNQTIDPTINQSYFWNLTGNIDFTIDDTNVANGETYVFNVEVTTATSTETLTFTNPECEFYGTYDATVKNKLTIEVSKLAVGGLKISVFINQPT